MNNSQSPGPGMGAAPPSAGVGGDGFGNAVTNPPGDQPDDDGAPGMQTGSDPMQMAGGSASPMVGAAGSGTAPDPAMMPTDNAGEPDAGMDQPGPPNGDDYLSDCDTEDAYVLTDDGVCRFPLPDGSDPNEAQLVLVLNGEVQPLEHVGVPFGCGFLRGGYYIEVDDATGVAHAELCPMSCLQVSSTDQVVAVFGCSTAP